MAKTAVASPLDIFPLAPSMAQPRIIASSHGDVGSGKTYFACTGPAPVVVFSLDDGTEGVVEEFVAAGKEIRLSKFDWTPADDEEPEDLQKLAIELRDRYIEELQVALKYARTIVVDKESDLWNMFRYAEFGRPKADIPRDFEAANGKMRKYLNITKKHPVNFFALQALRDEWGSATKKTGGKKRAGFEETAGIMNVDLFHERVKGKFYTTVLKARGPGAKDVQDQTYPNLDVKTLGLMLFPDSDEEAWD